MDLGMLLAITMIFIGSFVQSTIGFGLAIVTSPVLYQISPDYVPAPITIVALYLSLINAHHHKSTISMKGLWVAFWGRVPGSIAGMFLLYWVDVNQLSIWVGVMVLMSVGLSLLPLRIQPNSNRMMIAGFFSGFFGTSSGIGGPPMALLWQHQEANLIRANLSAFFVVSSLMSLIVLVPVNYMSLHHIFISLPLLPASYLGYRLAMKYVNQVPKETIRLASLIICFISGLVAIISSLVKL